MLFVFNCYEIIVSGIWHPGVHTCTQEIAGVIGGSELFPYVYKPLLKLEKIGN
jgi:hypothetical protein